MVQYIHQLRKSFGLSSGESLPERACPSGDATPATFMPWLRIRHVHEFAAGDTSLAASLTLLAALASELSPDSPVAWIGRRCWPVFQHFKRVEETGIIKQGCHLHLDPLNDAERLWGILEASRCPGIRVVVADGTGFNQTQARRLQLAAEAGNAVVLLARSPTEFSQPSWAATRWQVTPAPSSTRHPRWDIALIRAVGAQGQDALYRP